MKELRELTVFGQPDVLERVIRETEGRLSDGWSRDRKSESNLQVSTRDRAFCFRCPANSRHPEAALVMNLDGRCLTVVNIVTTAQALTRERYNAILVEFYLRFLQPVAAEANVSAELSSDERSLAEAFGWKPAELLTRFSRCANKAMTHPATAVVGWIS